MEKTTCACPKEMDYNPCWKLLILVVKCLEHTTTGGKKEVERM